MKERYRYLIPVGATSVVLGYASIAEGWKPALFVLIAVIVNFAGGAFYGASLIKEQLEEDFKE